MDKDLSFEVDIFDKAAIKTRLPELAKIIEAKRRELDELEQRMEQLRRWAGLPERERKRATKAAEDEREPSIQQEAVRIITESGRPMSTMEVMVEMNREASAKTVNWALWDAAAKRNLLRSMGHGRYAPLGYEADQDSLLPSGNGSGAKGKESSAPVTGDGS